MTLPRSLVGPPLLALVLAACGGGGEGPAGPAGPQTPGTPSPPSQGPPPTSAAISMTTSNDVYGESVSQFAPSSVTIARNGTVAFSNASGVAHNVTFASAAGAPADVDTHTSGTTTRSFPTAGTFAFACTNHPGMSGSVTVVP